MTLDDKLQSDLHNGVQIDEMERYKAYCLSQNRDGSQTILFENGNLYNITVEGKVIDENDKDSEVLINVQIISNIKSLINTNPILFEKYDSTTCNI